MARVLQLQLKISLYHTAVQLHNAKNMTTMSLHLLKFCISMSHESNGQSYNKFLVTTCNAKTYFFSLPSNRRSISGSCYQRVSRYGELLDKTCSVYRGMFRTFQDDLDNANDRIIINLHVFWVIMNLHVLSPNHIYMISKSQSYYKFGIDLIDIYMLLLFLVPIPDFWTEWRSKIQSSNLGPQKWGPGHRVRVDFNDSGGGLEPALWDTHVNPCEYWNIYHVSTNSIYIIYIYHIYQYMSYISYHISTQYILNTEISINIIYLPNSTLHNSVRTNTTQFSLHTACGLMPWIEQNLDDWAFRFWVPQWHDHHGAPYSRWCH